MNFLDLPKSLYSFNILYHRHNKIFCTPLLESGCREQVKAEDICTYFLCTDIVHISVPRQENARAIGTKGWTEKWMEKRRVRWRLDGYLQTENMEEKPRVLAS